MTSRATRPPRMCRLALTGVGLAAIVAGCFGEAPGSQVWGLNESDRDVVVASPLHSGSSILPARTWSMMFNSYSDPDREILVYDADCKLLATLPLRTSSATVRIDPAGEPELVEGTMDIPAGVTRDPLDTGQTFEPKSCP